MMSRATVHVSPKVGEMVVVEAVVHGSFQDSGELGAFFLQEEDADADGDPEDLRRPVH